MVGFEGDIRFTCSRGRKVVTVRSGVSTVTDHEEYGLDFTRPRPRAEEVRPGAGGRCGVSIGRRGTLGPAPPLLFS